MIIMVIGTHVIESITCNYCNNLQSVELTERIVRWYWLLINLLRIFVHKFSQLQSTKSGSQPICWEFNHLKGGRWWWTRQQRRRSIMSLNFRGGILGFSFKTFNNRSFYLSSHNLWKQVQKRFEIDLNWINCCRIVCSISIYTATHAIMNVFIHIEYGTIDKHALKMVAFVLVCKA